MNYVTTADMQIWCEQTIEEAPLSSLKTAAEHLLLSNKNLMAEVARLREESERRRVERAVALDVKSKEGLLASEWVLRTGLAERQAAEAGLALGVAGVEVERLLAVQEQLVAALEEQEQVLTRVWGLSDDPYAYAYGATKVPRDAALAAAKGTR